MVLQGFPLSEVIQKIMIKEEEKIESFLGVKNGGGCVKNKSNRIVLRRKV